MNRVLGFLGSLVAIFFIALFVAAILSLAGCGGGGSAAGSISAPPSAEGGSPATVPSPQRPKLIAYAVTLNNNMVDYVAAHIAHIETRPFDGMVINDYIGRNLLNTRLGADTPSALDSTGAVTYAAAAKGLAPLKGIFHKFTDNFVKVDFDLVGPPPALDDDAAWRVAYRGTANYARAVAATGLKGIFLDNEAYYDGNYWLYSGADLSSALALARQRGREFMQALQEGYPQITVILSHGAVEGCTDWYKTSGYFGLDSWLMGAYDAGMIEAATSAATIVDGDEEYGPIEDFTAARQYRKGQGSQSVAQCPFMDTALAGQWSGKVSVAFTTFDKQRPSMNSNNWTPITDVAGFQSTLKTALQSSDQYAWHYSQWQDWWGESQEQELQPWITAIEEAQK